MTTAENAANVPTARDLENEAAEVLIARGRTASRADNTRKTYTTGWNSFAQWAYANGVSTLPADPKDLTPDQTPKHPPANPTHPNPNPQPRNHTKTRTPNPAHKLS